MFNLYQGDCLDVMKEIPDNCIDLVLCDPPYGTTRCHWDSVIPFEPMWAQLKRVVKKSGAIVLTASQPFTTKLISSNYKMFKYELVWDKVTKGAPGLAKIRPMPSHENILIFGRGRVQYNPQMGSGEPYKDRRRGPKVHSDEHQYGFKNRETILNSGTRYPGSIYTATKHNRKGQHPTQKPVALMEYLIRTYTHPGETVLDFTMGSGTTGVAARRLARYFIGIELDPGYFEIAKKRIEDV